MLFTHLSTITQQAVLRQLKISSLPSFTVPNGMYVFVFSSRLQVLIWAVILSHKILLVFVCMVVTKIEAAEIWFQFNLMESVGKQN